MKNAFRAIALGVFALAGAATAALADSVPPIVPTKQVTYGAANKSLTSSADVTVDTATHRLTAAKGVATSTLTFNDGTILTSTNAITAVAAWGGIIGTLRNQSDLQAVFVGVGQSTVTLSGQISAVAVSTGQINVTLQNVVISTGQLNTIMQGVILSTGQINAKVLAIAVDTGTLSASTTSLQGLINSFFPVSLSTSVTGRLQPANMVSTVAFTSASNAFTAPQTFTSPLPSTFTFQLFVGSLTVADLNISSFVIVDQNHKLISRDLFGGTNVWSGFNTFSYPGGVSVSFGLSVGSETITGLHNAILSTDNNGVVGSTVVPVAAGGTGTTTPGIVAGTNISVSGTWPNQTINASASASGGASTLALATGTVGGVGVVVASPTAIINLETTQFNLSLAGGATGYLSLNQSSVTLSGNIFNIANRLVKLSATSQLPASDGNLLTNINGSQVTGTVPDLSLTTNVYLLNSSPTVSGFPSFNSPSGISVRYGISGGSITLTGPGFLSFTQLGGSYQFMGSSVNIAPGHLAVVGSSSFSLVDGGLLSQITGTSVYPATGTAIFPFGATLSTGVFRPISRIETSSTVFVTFGDSSTFVAPDTRRYVATFSTSSTPGFTGFGVAVSTSGAIVARNFKLPVYTAAQIGALVPDPLEGPGQVVGCSNCANTRLCVSTGPVNGVAPGAYERAAGGGCN